MINPVQESTNISEYGFVGGRRRHNATRRVQAVERRAKVRARVAELGWRYGTQAQVARELGVSEATVSRDLASIAPHVCPTCREPTTGRLWILMAAWPDNDYDDEDDPLDDDDEEYGLRARAFREEAAAELGHSLK